ncbi:MAG: ParB/RepB/Spo0J family partition protein, partial [Deltaproteobacteria bacterium]|nr:ParB/RepB/Spo0J family partition protein [Deltaproteobacteria bacterium]
KAVKNAKGKTTSATTEGSLTQDPFLAVLQQELAQHFKSKVKIHIGGKKGKLEIEFYGEEDLNRIVSLLKA